MTSPDPLPRPDAALESTSPEEEVVEATPDRDETTKPRGRHTWIDRLPESWRASVSVPRWEVAVAIGLISALLAVAIATSGLALTQSSAPPRADDASGAVTISDDFARGSEEALGVTSSGQPWEELQGDWGVGFNSAQIVRPDGNLPSLAVVDLEDTDGLVRVRLSTVTSGMGLAVRVLDAGTYLAVEAELGFGTFAIRRSVNGQVTELGGVGLTQAGDNVILEIRMRGDSVDIFINNAYVKTITDRPPAGATRVGLIGEAGSGDARWSVFQAQNDTSLTQGLPAPPNATAVDNDARAGNPSTTTDEG